MPPFATTIEEEGVLIDNFQLVEGGDASARPRRARCSRGGALSGAQPGAEHRRPEGADRGQREGRRASCAAMVAQYGLDVVARLHGPRAGQRRGGGAPRASRALKDGEFTLPLDNGARIQVAIRVDARAAQRRDRLHRHLGAAGEQLQRADRGLHGRGALRVPHPGRRRHPAERRLPQAAAGHHPAGLDAQSATAGGGGRRQRRDLDLHHQRAVRRAGRDGGGAVHDEQLHLRQRALPVLRDDLRAAPARAPASTAPAWSRRT